MFRLWIEWDFGQDNLVFSSELKAWDWFQKNVDLDELNNEFLTHRDIFDSGLASIQTLQLDP